jgi:hypothetical protein
MKNKFSFDEFKLIFSNIFRQQKSVSNRGSILVRMIAWGENTQTKGRDNSKDEKSFQQNQKRTKTRL